MIRPVHAKRLLTACVLTLGLVLLIGSGCTRSGTRSSARLSIDPDDIGGVVTGASGPEAGVWVIAETTDLPTKFVRIVVTDDRGQFVIPDLPAAKYNIWVRGYGLVDSPKTAASPGKLLDLKSVAAANPRAAAEIFPAGYWLSLLHVPEKSEFDGKGTNGIMPTVRNQEDWIHWVKSDGCTGCHQLGTKGTREIPKAFGTSTAAWERRIQSGQAGPNMITLINQFGYPRGIKMFADWTDRIAAGETPPAPPRPQGIERNVVITEWDWADPKVYLHDQVSTDRRDPRVNANGPVYGSLELSGDFLPVLDPVRAQPSRVPLTVRDPNTPRPPGPLQPSAYWGDETIWTSQNNVHNPMMDEQGRVWITSTIRQPQNNPDYCRAGSPLISAKLFPLNSSGRQLGMYRPEDAEADAHRYVLRHAPSDVRGGRKSDAVDERRRTGRRVAQHEDVR